MKPKQGNPQPSATRRTPAPLWGSGRQPLPMEWMDPMSWRLPSGKALAEFALQAGFLAPLMLGTPGVRRRKPVTNAVPLAPLAPPADQNLKEGPEATPSFRPQLRETR